VGVQLPAEISEIFGKHFNARNKSALLALYTDTALLTIDGITVARGKAAIDQMLTPLFEGPLKIDIRCVTCHQHGDTALVRSDWKLTDPNGGVAMTGSSAELIRKEADGFWRFIFDDATFASRPPAT